MTTELDSLQRERDFYRSLAELTEHDSLPALLDAALAVLIARVSAREAMIEVIDDAIDGAHVVAHGCERDRLTEISSFVSRGIIGEAIATGKTIATANAAEDPRFLQFESVQRHRLEGVLCVPIGQAVHAGVVYLQGKQGTREFHPYDARVQREVELFARVLSGPLEHLLGPARDLKAGLGQHHVVRPPLDQGDAEFVLQVADLHRERRLGHRTGLGGLAEVAMRRQGGQIPQLFQGDHADKLF